MSLVEIFLDVSQLGSFAAAARARDVDPSHISRAVAALEDELGVRLFQRTTRRMQLTEAGTHFARRAGAVVEELDRAREEARSITSEVAGTLRVTASVAFGNTCLVPLLPALRKRHPALKLELALTDGNLDLISQRMDLAIRLAPSISDDVVCSRLFDTRYHVCASPDWVAANGLPPTPAAIGQQDCLLFMLQDYRTSWQFKAADGSIETVPVKGCVILSNALAMRSAMLDGLGPALLADWLIGDDLQCGACIDLFPGHVAAATSFDTGAWLLYPSRQFLPRKVRVFIDFLREELVPRRRLELPLPFGN